MKKLLITLALVASLAVAQDVKKHEDKKHEQKSEMKKEGKAKSPIHGRNFKSAGSMQWVPAPPGLPAGGQITVLQGDPGRPGAFTIRLKMPAGYKIPPHWHPAAEHVTFISGDFSVGSGDTLNEGTAQRMVPGDFLTLPAKHRHYGIAKTESVIQISSNGPFTITYVNPSDDPRKTK